MSKLLDNQKQLIDIIKDAEGEITEEQDLIWQNQDIAIKDKVDAYGYVLSNLKAEQDMIKQIKKEANERVKQAQLRVENAQDRLKSRLNYLSEGSPLRGHVYSFHPYLAKKRTVDIDFVEPEDILVTVEMSQDLVDILQSDIRFMNKIKISSKRVRVTDLPDEHPAVTIIQTPSVRMS